MRDFQLPGRSTVHAANGIAATSHPLASKVAVEMLESGGNAVDAALAAAVLQGICEPQMTGIGGDLFALVAPGDGGDVVGLNGSGRAPAGMDAQSLRDAGLTGIDASSPHAVTIPGAVDAICRLSADHGRKSLGDILAPAIRYAKEGVPVAPRVARDWKSAQSNLQGSARDLFLTSGAPYAVGEVFALPAQAATLERIADEGRTAFYEGPVADEMVSTLQAAGGPHSAKDFAATSCDYVTPVRSGYKGLDLIELPPNGQGIAAILMLNILSHFDLAAMDPIGADRIHLEAEATKLAYDARNRFVADPDHVDADLDRLLSIETARRLADLIDPRVAMQAPAPLTEAIHNDTIYLTVVDRDRMAVSLICSIFNSFGSGIAAPESGVLLHNRGSGFNLIAGHPNEAGPGKRPMHTIIPGMLAEQGRVTMPFGVMGGQYQSCGHARFVSNLVDFGMDIQSAISAPRSFAVDGELRLERGHSDETREALRARGHTVSIPEGPIGGAQAIRIDRRTATLEGASDHRKDGIALGY